MVVFWGKFSILDDDLEEFYNLYSRVLGKVNMHFIEKPKEVGPLLIDIDWHFSLENNERQYSEDDIKYIIMLTNKIIKRYYKCKGGYYRAFVMEKDKPSPIIKKNQKTGYKDGLHIIYPHLKLPVIMRYVILDELQEEIENDIKCGEGLANIPSTNSLDDIVDKCIVNQNGWCLYGSKKNKGSLYELTSIVCVQGSLIFDN